MSFKRLIGLVFVGALACGAAMADVVVRIGPPHRMHENRGRRPSRDHVWVQGYHRWDGNAYGWQEGRWEQPPRPRARWEAHHWVHTSGGWVLVEGRWR